MLVLSYTVNHLPTVVLVVEHTPAVEFVRMRRGVTRCAADSVQLVYGYILKIVLVRHYNDIIVWYISYYSTMLIS